MNELLDWLFVRQRFDLGLERTRDLLTLLGNPQQHFKSIIVGGTNGKGSTSATLASILKEAGYKTALFTSPHLTYFSERFRVNGERLLDTTIEAALQQIKPFAEQVGASFYEIVTVLGCQLFADANVDYAVMEVGMGGRFDATNVLEPVLSIITGIALDHTKYLGDTPEKIAFEKAGILRAAKPAFTGARDGALHVIKERARELGSSLHVLDEDIHTTLQSVSWQGTAISVKNNYGDVRVQSPLLGLHQVRNVALAVAAAQSLGVRENAIRSGVAGTQWAGRLEKIIYKNRLFLLDGAHNQEAAEVVKDTLQALHTPPIILLFGIAKDKDIEPILKTLEGVARHVILSKAQLSPRAAEPSELAEITTKPHTAINNLHEALEHAVNITTPGEMILVAGSLYLIGEVRPYVLGEVGERFERHQ
ncbi:MAG: bifunctional folylpolyglutamate synthase/dihydrofolate synthase [Trueperaceae bacterium]